MRMLNITAFLVSLLPHAAVFGKGAGEIAPLIRKMNFGCRPHLMSVDIGEFWPEKIGCDAYSVLRQPCGDETKECGNPGKK